MNILVKSACSLLILFCFIPPYQAASQDEGFIYGKITTIDNKTFEGPLRWGKEEAYWTDLFNASKRRNDNLRYLSNDQMRDLSRRNEDNHWFVRWVSDDHWFGDDDRRHTHQFVCQFGNIKSIRPTGRNAVEVVLQNGDRLEFDGEGYNDIGTDVRVVDAEIGEIELSWGRIEKIEFSSTPQLKAKFGEPLYGTVETRSGTFTGLVQWDHDERVGTDKLDGDSSDGDVSIPFDNIRSIERLGYGSSRVILKSGRDLELRGSNDVNSENRGIIVTTEKSERIDIDWEDFEKVTFADKPSGKLKSYADFKNQIKLEGTVVTTDGESHKGRIVYDLDEEHNYEVLQGEHEDMEYTIAFGDIKRVVPKNYDFSDVELKNGTKLLLQEGQDVSDRNSGMLIFKGSGDPVYVPWEKVREITFN